MTRKSELQLNKPPQILSDEPIKELPSERLKKLRRLLKEEQQSKNPSMPYIEDLGLSIHQLQERGF